MADWKGVGRAVPVWLAVPFAALAWGAYALRESTMAVVGDLAGPGLVLAAVAMAFAGWGLLLLRDRAGGRVSRAVGVVVVVVGAVAFGALLWYRGSYSAEEVRFMNGDVELAGTLYTPREAGPHPAAVLVHGSGRVSRREPSFYARYLARRGIAALAYDKRGVGASTGALYESDYADYAGDALAGVRRLAGHPDVDGAAIGLIGFSEGEWVAPIAASGSDAIAFVAIIGASGLVPAEQVSMEIAIRLRTLGYPDSVVSEALDLNRQLLEYQRTGLGGEALAVALANAASEPWFEDAGDFPPQVYSPEDYAWWRSVMDMDPVPFWERVEVPVLLLKGGRDDMSPAGLMESRIRAALARGGNEDLTVEIYPDADHMLLEWPRGDGSPPPAFTAGYPDVLVRWILEKTGR